MMNIHRSRARCGPLLALLLALAVASPLWPPAPTAAQGSGGLAWDVELVGQLGGATRAVAVEGHYAYVGVGLRLAVVDVADPTRPALVGQTDPLPGFVRHLAVADGRAYVAAEEQGLLVIDVSNPAAPRLVGAYDTPGVARAVAVVGAHVFVADNFSLRILDVSGPAGPTEVGNLEPPVSTYGPGGPGSVAAVAVAPPYAYFSGYQSLFVADVSEPSQPRIVGSDARYGQLSATNNYVTLAVEGGRAYSSGGPIWDVSDPANPVVLGSLATGGQGFVQGVTVRGSLAYASVSRDGLRVADVTNPAATAGIGWQDTPGDTTVVALAGNYAYVADGPAGLRIVDVADPRRPVEVGAFEPGLGSLAEVAVSPDGARAYVGSAAVEDLQGNAQGRQGLRVVDVSAPARPALVGVHDTPGRVEGIGLREPLVYVAERLRQAGGVRVLDTANPASPREVSFLPTAAPAFDIAAGDQYAYVAAGTAGLRIVDVSEPARPREVGAYALSQYQEAAGVVVDGPYAYLSVRAGFGSSLRVLDVSDPTRPVEAAPVRAPGGALALSGSRLYVAGGGGRAAPPAGVRILSLADGAEPREVGFFALQAPVGGLAVAGERAYVAATREGLRVLDVSDPSQPTEAGFYRTPREARAVAALGDPAAGSGEALAYVAAEEAGLLVLRYRPGASAQVPPPVPHDERYFFETNFRIEDDAIWGYFQARGGIETFGFPVSRTFTFLGCPVQVFQRQIAQHCPGQGVALMNVLDPELFPYTQVNGSTFPAPDEALKNATPQVGEPEYAERILEFVRANAPDEWNGQPVNFASTFFGAVTPEMVGTNDPGLLGLLALEVWSAPISPPMADPSNPNFVYQRFQRGIMHFTAGEGTRGILLADYLKSILLGPALAPPYGASLPPDLAQQAAGSRTFAQYCPGAPAWTCRSAELPGTDLTFAFEPD